MTMPNPVSRARREAKQAILNFSPDAPRLVEIYNGLQQNLIEAQERRRLYRSPYYLI